MNLNHITNKQTGDSLTAAEWNKLASDVNELGAGGNNSGSSDSVGTYFYMNDKGNLCIETTAENTPTGKKGKINIESNDDIQLKPGDDIMLYGDHRGEGKTDEVSIKVMDGTGEDDVPAKLQMNMSEITLTTKDKVGNDAGVLDININKAKNTKGYLKVRAQAIDLRCEDHGGIAIQPKGKDSDNFENKIKFEHGGGDGLEFGTFNTEHTSIFTDDYRFNKDGKIRLATRFTVASDKADANDSTTAFKYIKNNAENNAAKALETGITYRAADDFYDFIDDADPSAKWEDVVNVANGTFGEIDGITVQKKYTKKGNTKDCDTISVVALNNHQTDNFVVDGVTVAPGTSQTIASCSILDMIKLVNYMKTNNQGPWASVA